jgi:uncharacterized membrane protein YgcG
MLDPLSRLSNLGSIVGMHMRTGYADWSHLNVRQAQGAYQPDSAQAAAVSAPRMPFSRQWAVFEGGLLDCLEPAHKPGAPCFNWRGAEHRSPTAADAQRLCAATQPRLGASIGGGATVHLRTPANGTLAAAALCAASFGQRLAARRGPAARGNRSNWGLLVLGDSPALPSLLRALPELGARVVDTRGIGSIGHTSFGRSCEAKPGVAGGGASGGTASGGGIVSGGGGGGCLSESTVDPAGAWTRGMVDMYLGGVATSAITVLFSSWGSAMLSRSLLCCRHRHHFGAMYSQVHSHRDKPMGDVDFLQAVTQVETPGAGPGEW